MDDRKEQTRSLYFRDRPTFVAYKGLVIMSAIAKQQKDKGDAFMAEAKATLAKKTWFASGTEQKNEDAAELYQKAANAFKVGSYFTEAGDAYAKAAAIYKGALKNGIEASKCMAESGRRYRAYSF
jgi:alpha-soluble NSF attachment protein